MAKESINQVPPPFLVSYSITTKCNLMCKHCYSESVDQAAPDELSTEEAFRLMDDLSKWGISLLVIDGGEPLCREDMLDVVKYASSKGLRTTLGSNGTLIDEAMARKMLGAGEELMWRQGICSPLTRGAGLLPRLRLIMGNLEGFL